MHAEGSAQREAQRARAQADYWLRRAEHFERGADHELSAGRALETLPAGWVVLRDRRWPGREHATLDHVVIGPGGVFVVETNRSSQLSLPDGRLVRSGRSAGTGTALTASSAADAALAVAALVAPYAQHCHPVLCLAGSSAGEGGPLDVLVCVPGTVVAMLTSRPNVLTDDEVRDAAARLDGQLVATEHAVSEPAPSPLPPARPVRVRRASLDRPLRRRRRRRSRAVRLVAGIALVVCGLTLGPTVATRAGELVTGVVAGLTPSPVGPCLADPSDQVAPAPLQPERPLPGC